MCIEMSLTFRIPPLCESERERLGAGVNKMLHIPFHVNTDMKILMHPFWIHHKVNPTGRDRIWYVHKIHNLSCTIFPWCGV